MFLSFNVCAVGVVVVLVVVALAAAIVVVVLVVVLLLDPSVDSSLPRQLCYCSVFLCCFLVCRIVCLPVCRGNLCAQKGHPHRTFTHSTCSYLQTCLARSCCQTNSSPAVS